MDMKTSTDGNTSIPGSKPSAATIKDGTRIANPCSICGQGDYATYRGGKWFFVLHTLSRNWQTVQWTSSNLGVRQVQDMMIALRPCYSPYGTAITGPSKPK